MLSLLYGSSLISIHDYWKNHSFDYMDLCWQIAFLPKSKRLFILWLQSGFSVVETEVDIFLGFPCFLYNPANVGNLISCSFAFSETSLDAWKFLVHVMLKPSMQDFVNDLTSMGDKSNCLVV